MPTVTNLNQEGAPHLDEGLCELLGISLLVSDNGENSLRMRDLTLAVSSI